MGYQIDCEIYHNQFNVKGENGSSDKISKISKDEQSESKSHGLDRAPWDVFAARMYLLLTKRQKSEQNTVILRAFRFGKVSDMTDKGVFSPHMYSTCRRT